MPFFREAGFGDAASGIKQLSDHARPPGPSIGGPADHDAVRARSSEHRASVSTLFRVAVCNQRNGNAFAHAPNGMPIGLAAIELAACAAMHGDHLHAASSARRASSGALRLAVIPAKPHLQRHRNRGGTDSRLDQPSAHGPDRASRRNPKGHLSLRGPDSPC